MKQKKIINISSNIFEFSQLSNESVKCQLGLALRYRNLTIFNIIRWVAGSIIPLTERLMVDELF